MIHRFGLIVEELKRAIVWTAERNRALAVPLTVLLWTSLSRRLRLLAALQARFAAGTLRSPSSRRRPECKEATVRPGPAPGRLPRGALLRYGAAHQQAAFRALLDHPETRALLAATPQAGRLLRPLWRMLSTDPLPEALRLPPRPRPARPPSPSVPAVPPRRLAAWSPLPRYTPQARSPNCPRPQNAWAAPFRPPRSRPGPSA